MMHTAEGPSALPLWINGHAFLTMAPAFLDVINPQTGQALRRVPLCGAEQISQAVAAAQTAVAAWHAASVSERENLLHEAAALLERYATHFAKLLAEETGMNETQAAQEVQTALKTLQDIPPSARSAPVCAVLTDATTPLAAPLALIAQALVAGQAIILKTSPKCPSPLFALAEVMTRAGLPDGVLNVVHGDEAAVAALATHPEVSEVHFSGTPALAATIQQMLEPHRKVLIVQAA